MIQKVLVPLDGSRVSEEVLPPVIRLVKESDGSLILFHAVTPSEYFSVTAAQYVQQAASAVLATLTSPVWLRDLTAVSDPGRPNSF